MMRSIRPLGTTAMIAGLTTALLAQGAPKISVKMGLWEVTSTTNMTGSVPMPDTSQMTPQQAKQLLDSQKDDEQVLRLAPPNKNTLQSGSFKNW